MPGDVCKKNIVGTKTMLAGSPGLSPLNRSEIRVWAYQVMIMHLELYCWWDPSLARTFTISNHVQGGCLRREAHLPHHFRKFASHALRKDHSGHQVLRAILNMT